MRTAGISACLSRMAACHGALHVCVLPCAAIFSALSPHYMFIFWRDARKDGWEVMAGVLLCITGVEAMYADLGHFSRRAVQVNITYPCITCTSMHVSQTQVVHAFPAPLCTTAPVPGGELPAQCRTMVYKAQRLVQSWTVYLPLQLSFSCVVYPSVVITYLGQAAYLYQNPDDYDKHLLCIHPQPSLLAHVCHCHPGSHRCQPGMHQHSIV